MEVNFSSRSKNITCIHFFVHFRSTTTHNLRTCPRHKDWFGGGRGKEKICCKFKLQFFKTVSRNEYGGLFLVQNMDLVKIHDLHVGVVNIHQTEVTDSLLCSAKSVLLTSLLNETFPFYVLCLYCLLAVLSTMRSLWQETRNWVRRRKKWLQQIILNTKTILLLFHTSCERLHYYSTTMFKSFVYLPIMKIGRFTSHLRVNMNNT